MKSLKYFLFIIPVLLCSLYCTAQETKEKEYIYQDSSILYPQADTAVADTNDEEEDSAVYTAPENFVDTMLYNNQHTLSPDSIRVLKNDKAFAYAKNLDSLLKKLQLKKKEGENGGDTDLSWLVRFFSSPVTKVVFIILAVFFILFIIYRLFFADGFFRGGSTRTDARGGKEEEDLKDTDFNKKIKEAVAERNYRLATRWLYLQTLHELTAAGIIIYGVDKTNRQYFYELGGKPYQQDFAQLCSHYEYVWYGEFETGELLFSKIQDNFKQFNSRIKN